MVFVSRSQHTGERVHDVLRAAPLVWREIPPGSVCLCRSPHAGNDALLDAGNRPALPGSGEVSEAQKDSLLRQCTVFCMPSREESLGATYLEAWSHGSLSSFAHPAAGRTDERRTWRAYLQNSTPWDVATPVADSSERSCADERDGRVGAATCAWSRYSWNAIVAAHRSDIRVACSMMPTMRPNKHSPSRAVSASILSASRLFVYPGLIRTGCRWYHTR